MVTGTIQEKTASCIGNLKAVLTAAGSGIEKVVKVNVFITDMANFAVRNTTTTFRHKWGKQSFAHESRAGHERGIQQMVHPQASSKLCCGQAAAQGS